MRRQVALALGALIPAIASAQSQLAARQWTTPSGARVQFVESRAVPMVDIAVDFAAGSAYDPPAKPGTAALTHALLDAGTADLSEDELAAAYADVGALLSGTVDRDRATVQLRTLASAPELSRAVAAFAAMVQRPALPPAAFERERARLAARMREEEVEPGALADRRFYAGLYRGHPYGQTATAETVSALEREDVLRFHRGHYTADRVVVTILGDLSLGAAREIAAQLTAALPPRGYGAAVPPVEPPPRAAHIAVPHPAQQAHVRVGVPALARTDPDYFPLLVGNYVLGGGGFVSRLTRDIRDERGYAYSVYSYFLPLARPGPFQIGLQTRRDQAEAALVRVRAVVGEFLANGPTERELADAKASLAGGFPLRIDSNRKLLNEWAIVGFYRLPETWLAEFPRAVERVTAADVRAAFARHVQPERFVTVVVGADEGK
ncbi:MAG TPA: pitrilysin family protein [Burkholderiales bacterium]|nr:pitrilysin family protein [Burkholderiales bacterium]